MSFNSFNMDFDQELSDKTCGQQSNELWWQERKGRLTASKFGRLMSAKNDLVLARLKDDINSENIRTNYVPPACAIGISEEENAKQAYVKHMKDKHGVIAFVRNVGLCVPNWCKQIGSSPDGIVDKNGQSAQTLLEIKCLFDNKPLPRSIDQIAKDRGSKFYCKYDDNCELTLKHNHNYYYQVLGGMAITGIRSTDFVIYHPRTGELKVIIIDYNHDDWLCLKERLDYFTGKYLKI